MKRLETLASLRRWRQKVDGSVGLVPTMGFLHEGHLALVHRSVAENARTVVSIFVNPAQFNDPRDLDGYPRDLDRDLTLLEAAGCAAVYLPEAPAMYPPGFDTWVVPGAVAEPNEGRHRPGHFRGVATVVLKLFLQAAPQRAYFGQKDAQQLAVVRAMVRDLDVPVEVVAVPTVRASDGLALSSRNVRLDADERRAAAVVSRALRAGRAAFDDGEREADALRAQMRAVLDTEPRATVDYVSVADPDTLEELHDVSHRALLSLAVTIGRARLIDNLPLEATPERSAAPPGPAVGDPPA